MRMPGRKEIEKRIGELLDRPFIDAKIQIDIHTDEVPTIRYDITELVVPESAIRDDVKTATEPKGEKE